MDDKEFFEYQRGLNADMFNFASGYLQALVVAGYAGIFFLWDQAKDWASPGVWAFAGLLLAFSLGAYVLWEVYAFLLRQRLAMDTAVAITEAEGVGSREVFVEKTKKLTEDLRQSVRNTRRLWSVAMACIVWPLVAAWFLIGSLFVWRLIRTIAACAA
jgi:hypothetical protein